MDPLAESAPEPVILIIADISGYTRYMTANAKTMAHSQMIITELVTAIVQAVDMPLEVAKLEGDAVFLYGRKGRHPEAWLEKKKLIGQKLFTFFVTFRAKVNELSYSTTCSCRACTHIEKLRLKLVVHSGEALFHRVLNFQELAGVDVIIVHRLLKNSVGADQYLLLTEAAQKDVELPDLALLAAGAESYPDLGRIVTGVYFPDPPPARAHGDATSPPAFANRFASAWRFSLKLWFKSLPALWFANSPQFNHLESTTGLPARFGFGLLTLLLTPIYVPVSGLSALWHARRRPPESAAGD